MSKKYLGRHVPEVVSWRSGRPLAPNEHTPALVQGVDGKRLNGVKRTERISVRRAARLWRELTE